jgi:Aerotolerance regulator N-terminal/von Willebrand factor type A domain
MGLGFLVPAFLIGLAAIAIPVIVHLLNRERKEVIRFPSLMFLERIPYRAIRKQTIRHPLLLALRALAILLLVAAFARPFLERATDPTAGLPGGRDLVVLLDRSYSMGYGDRWSRAVQATRNEAAGLRAGDRITLIAFDDKATVLGGPSADAGFLLAAVDTLHPGDRTTQLGPALAAAREMLSASTSPRREVVLISDLQRAAWDGRTDGRLPANVESRVVSVADSSTGNALVAGVEIDRTRRAGQTLAGVVAQIRNQEGRSVRRQASLAVQGRQVDSREVEIPPRGIATVRFSQVPVPPTAVEATVRLEPDALGADDTLHFSLSRDQALPVLLLTARAGAPRSIYLQRALALGSDPPIDLTVQSPGGVRTGDLDRFAVVILNNIGFPGGSIGTRLAELVRAGTGLIVVAGEGNDPARWNPDGSSLLPATSRGVIDRTEDRGGRLGNLERSHRIFQPFAGPRSGDFSSARFLRYRLLEPADSAGVLAWYDDGHVALVEGKSGLGRVLLWGSTLDDFWNDLVVQPVFLPFLLTTVRYAAGYIPDPAWRTVGQQVALAAPDSTASGSQGSNVIAPDGTRERLADRRALRLDRPGFYRVLNGNAPENARLIAVNVDRAESDFRTWNPDELKATIVSNDSLPVTAAAEVLTDTQREQRQRVWWFLLLAAALLLLTEVILANRMSRVAL